MKPAAEIAREIVKSAEDIHGNITNETLIKAIAAAIEQARKPNEPIRYTAMGPNPPRFSLEEAIGYAVLNSPKNSFDLVHKIMNYVDEYVSKLEIPVPTEQEIKDAAKHEDSDGYFGFVSGARWVIENIKGE